MKKIVGTIAAIALAASSAFAGVNVGMGFNRGFFVPFAYDGTDAKAGISTSWGAEPRVGVSFSAASEQVGVVADVKFDGGNVAVNDNAYIWVKPVEWFKMNIGQSFDDTLRGNACVDELLQLLHGMGNAHSTSALHVGNLSVAPGHANGGDAVGCSAGDIILCVAYHQKVFRRADLVQIKAITLMARLSGCCDRT